MIWWCSVGVPSYQTLIPSFYCPCRGESIVYYMMVAETGLEVAQFNVAHLCEEDYVSFYQPRSQWCTIRMPCSVINPGRSILDI